jgi:pyruvate dehydrogenase (quinone)
MPHVVPKDADLKQAADVLNAGNKVAILIGAGTLGAATEVLQVADLLGAGIAKALLGKAALPDDCLTSPVLSTCSAPSRVTTR